MTSGVLKMLECRANISPALIAARAGAAAGNQTTDRLGDVNKAAPMWRQIQQEFCIELPQQSLHAYNSRRFHDRNF
jgi:hypothetical protein